MRDDLDDNINMNGGAINGLAIHWLYKIIQQ